MIQAKLNMCMSNCSWRLALKYEGVNGEEWRAMKVRDVSDGE